MPSIRFPFENDTIRSVLITIDIGVFLFVVLSMLLSISVLMRRYDKKFTTVLATIALILGVIALVYFSISFYDIYFSPRVMY